MSRTLIRDTWKNSRAAQRKLVSANVCREYGSTTPNVKDTSFCIIGETSFRGNSRVLLRDLASQSMSKK